MTSTKTSAVQGPALWPRAALALAIIVSFAGVVAVAQALAVRPPLPGRPQADTTTLVVSLVADYIARIAWALTMGALASAVFFLRPDADGHLSPVGRRSLRTAAHAGQVWAWASVLLTFANAAYVNGVPLGLTLRPAAWFDFQASTPSSLAWTLSALVAGGCVLAAYRARTLAPVVLALTGATASALFVAVTGNVTVGAAHDWATDAAVWQTLAVTILVATAFAALLSPADNAGRRLRRYHRLAVWFLVPATSGLLVIAWQQLAGTPATADLYGQLAIGQGVVLALVCLSWLARALVRPWRGRRPLPWALADAVLLVAWLALAASENHTPSPRFLIPQTAAINYLGYEIPPAVDAARLFALGRPNWLWVVLSAFAIVAYLWGVAKVVRRGGRWPIGRLIAWIAGWLLMIVLATTGFWEYSTVLYSWHMFVHMTVNMLVPVLCVLGGPLTLLRTASVDRSEDLPGAREASEALTLFRPLAVLLSPPVLWANYVGSLFVIYYTPLFPWLMRYHWAHQLMLLYFMATGFAFFNMIVGVDKVRSGLPHLLRLALVISIMPFHAIFAVGIMSSKSLFGADFYRSIAVPWVGDLMADQNTAGQITWILGEVPLFIVMIALAAQWFAHDRAENRVSDAAQDSGADESFDAYNDMLAELAARDRQASREKFS